MAAEYPLVYPYSRAEARRSKETQMHEESFRLNVRCARAIERALRDHFNERDEALREGCAQSILDEYGFKRVLFVLSNSVKGIPRPCQISDELRQWAQKTSVPPDGKYNRCYAVDTAATLLESFTRQVKDQYQTLGLFGPEHRVYAGDYEGKVLILRPDVLQEDHWSPRDQLWLATGGAGCTVGKLGRTVFATCLGDGEQARFDRSDFIGILDKQFLPDWAAEKLAELRGPQEQQPERPSGGMEMK